MHEILAEITTNIAYCFDAIIQTAHDIDVYIITENTNIADKTNAIITNIARYVYVAIITDVMTIYETVIIQTIVFIREFISICIRIITFILLVLLSVILKFLIPTYKKEE